MIYNTTVVTHFQIISSNRNEFMIPSRYKATKLFKATNKLDFSATKSMKKLGKNQKKTETETDSNHFNGISLPS